MEAHVWQAFTFPAAATTDRLTVFRMLWQGGQSASDSRRDFNPPESGPDTPAIARAPNLSRLPPKRRLSRS